MHCGGHHGHAAASLQQHTRLCPRSAACTWLQKFWLQKFCCRNSAPTPQSARCRKHCGKRAATPWRQHTRMCPRSNTCMWLQKFWLQRFCCRNSAPISLAARCRKHCGNRAAAPWLAAAHSDVPTQCHIPLAAEILAAEILLQTGCKEIAVHTL